MKRNRPLWRPRYFLVHRSASVAVCISPAQRDGSQCQRRLPTTYSVNKSHAPSVTYCWGWRDDLKVTESEGERILKIDHHLAKLQTRERGYTMLAPNGHRCEFLRHLKQTNTYRYRLYWLTWLHQWSTRGTDRTHVLHTRDAVPVCRQGKCPVPPSCTPPYRTRPVARTTNKLYVVTYLQYKIRACFSVLILARGTLRNCRVT